MKTRILLAAIAILSLTGCEDKRVSQLEKDVKELTAIVGTLAKTQNAAVAETKASVGLLISQFQAMTNEVMTMARVVESTVDQIPLKIATAKEELLQEIKSSPPESQRRAQARAQVGILPAPRTKAGVPADVYDQIARTAAKEWPGNFEMQEYQIKNQLEAFRKLQTVR